MSESHQPDETHSLPWKKTVIICCSILLAAGAISLGILYSEPTSKPTGATKKTPMLVKVTQAKRETFRPQIEALGTVEPALDITLSPRISGETLKLAKNFIPGGFVSKGDLLLQIDPSDYENTLEQRQSALRSAESQLSIELGRQDVAQKEYQLLGESLSDKNEELILRRPQLNSARADVESARAAVKQAKLDLERTSIEAPFDAQILERNVNVGSQVARGDNLGRLVGTDEYWVVATVPLSKRHWIEVNENEETKQGSPVIIRNRAAWEEGIHRDGRVEKLIGTLDENTRMARLLVTVPDPLALDGETQGPPLIIGSILHLVIEGKKIPDVVRLNRDYIREHDKVWVMENEKLQIRKVDIVFRDANYAYIRKGLRQGEDVVTTNLATVTEDAPLRTKSNEEQETQEGSE